jgi:outer membrane receptor protein involved in Fe transport
VVKNNRLALSISTVLGTCAAAAAANAQQAAPAATTGGLEEVVVTAQRRVESIQDVPITIQAIGSEQLSRLNVRSLDDVIRLLPNVTYAANGPGQGTVYMRGLSVGYAGSQSSASINPFPNVASYLDEQAMSFPGRSVDIYIVDMERIEVLEGPQGTLFGGSAQAGVIRYITNKPKLNVTEGRAEGSYGWTAHGDPNTAINLTVNIPLIQDHLAFRGVVYNDRRGGYIDNVATNFTRDASVDHGPSGYSSNYPVRLQTYNNNLLVQSHQNPVTYQGVRLQLLYQINDDWNALIQQQYQYLDAEGMPVQMPISIGCVPSLCANGPLSPLQPLQESSFMPAWNRDHVQSTAWTLNGKMGDYLKGIYTGSYLTRHVDANMDYSNYTRTAGGFYYSCVGGGGSNLGNPGPAICYSPVMGWNDYFTNTHQSHEIRVSTREDFRLRGLFGAYWEDFKIKDNMNFLQKTIPSCTPQNLANAIADGTICLANVNPVNAVLDPTTRNDNINFGEDMARGYQQRALFTSIDFDLIPKTLTITGGTRYYHYDEFQHGSQYTTGGRCENILNSPTACLATPFDYHATYSGWKSRGNLTWHITPDVMVYYTFSQGFRPGAFNRLPGGRTNIWVDANGVPLPNGVDKNTVPGATKPTQFVKPTAYGPDSLTNNEIGMKSEFLEHRLQVNVSLYQMDWKDVQTLIYNPPVYGNTTFGIQGPNYRIKGGELQLQWKATDELTFMGSASYNDNSQTNSPCIKSIGVNPYNPANPTPAGTCITQVRSGNVNVPIVNPLGAVGSTPAFSPKLKFDARIRYDWTFNGYNAFAQVGMSHVGDMYNQPSSFPSGDGVTVPKTTWLRYTMASYNTYDAQLGFAKDAWDFTIYGTNLSNSNASTFTTSGQDVKAEYPLVPRIIGLKVGLHF